VARLFRRIMTVGLLLVVMSVVTGGTAGGQTAAEIEALKVEREAFQEQVLATAASVNAATVEAEELNTVLADIELLVAGQRDDLAVAERDADTADALVVVAQQRQLTLAGERDKVRQQAVDLAVQTYVGRDSRSEGSFGLARTGDIYVSARIETIVGVAFGDISDTSDELRALELDTAAAEEDLAAAAVVQETLRVEAANQLEQLLDAVELQARIVNDAELRLDARLAEAAAVAEVDAALGAEIQRQEAELARRLEEARRAREAEERRIRQEEARRLAEEQERQDAARRATEGTAPAPSTNNVSSGEITNVGGIGVHESIADNVRRLLDAAAADGVQLGGGGYRSSSSQISLRRSNCGTSDYAIYQMPSSQCSPPTARPGASMHERGLAIDFTQNGRALTRSTSGYEWLRANASSYGLRNLPSEPWHWSTNGS
jgi:LAS superfamily LD-carboxypeptidase LdcB